MPLALEERARLESIARRCRADAIRMIAAAGSGNPGSCLSAADLIVFVYEHLMRIGDRPLTAPERDRVCLSKGHAVPIFYSLLMQRGLLDPAEIGGFRGFESRLQTHPDLRTPGVDFPSGSLGMGLSAAVGMAMSFRLQGKPHRCFVLQGDGESQEGQVWEAALAAAQQKLSRILLLVDANGFQGDAPIAESLAMEPLADKWRSFGWDVVEADGNDFDALRAAVDTLEAGRDERPRAIIARTRKGKGVSFMEGNNAWHTGAHLTEALVQQALAELGH